MAYERISPQEAADMTLAMETHMLAAHVLGEGASEQETITGIAAVLLGLLRHAPGASIAIEYGDGEDSSHLVTRIPLPREGALKFEMALAAERAVEGL